MPMYQIDGFAYTNRERAKQAKKEKDGIRYIRERTSLNNPDVIFRLYNKLLDDNVFETEVGILFLKELQQELVKAPNIEKTDIRPIPIPEDAARENERERQKAKERAERARKEEIWRDEANRNYKKKYRAATFLCGVLAAALIGIFAITAISGKNATIFNYEEQIINKYAAWEEELSERERAVSEREHLLQQGGF